MKLNISKDQYIKLRQSGMTENDIVRKHGPNAQSPLMNAADKVTDLIGARAIADTYGSEIAQYKAPNQLEKNIISQDAPTVRQTVGSALQTGSLLLPGGAIAGGITAGARTLGMRAGASALGKIGSGAGIGYAFDVGSNLQTNQPAPGTPGLGTALGAAIPAVGVGLNVLGRGAAKVAPKLLSYTSDVPEKAFETMLQRRQPVTQAIKAGTSGEMALSETQAAVRQLRKTLSQEWQDGAQSIYNEFNGKQTVNISGALERKLLNVADDFGLDLPQNIKNVSAKETMDLLKQINELPQPILTMSPKGAIVRQVKEMLREKAITTFGGENGSLATLYKNYSAKKGVHDAANDIVKAYSTGKPIQQSTALGRLSALFAQNKSAYLDAILDLEQATGKDLLSKITAAQFQNKLPTGTSAMTASGTLRQSKSAFDKAIDLLILPLSSPRSAALITRALSKAKSPTITTPGDMFLKTRTGQAVTDYAQTVQPGLSTKAVKIHPEDSQVLQKFIDGIRLKGQATQPPFTEKEAEAAETILIALGQSLDQPLTKLADIAENILTGKIDSTKLYRTGRKFNSE